VISLGGESPPHPHKLLRPESIGTVKSNRMIKPRGVTALARLESTFGCGPESGRG
jgi:hypothetical protein